MKTLKDLKAFSLDKKQMNQIEGGAYCDDLRMIMKNGNLDEERQAIAEYNLRRYC